MTKEERKLCNQITSSIHSIKTSLTYNMKDYDCSWPKPIIAQLENVFELLVKMQNK